MNEREIFHAAAVIADPAERSVYLAKVCAGNVSLKQHVESMLEVYPQLGKFLESPAVALEHAASLPASVGHFQLGAEIGSGGMGVVYLARDLTLDRDVAIKTLNHHHDADSEASQRFLIEARIAGRLAHPGIPAVHELGTLTDGRPFLAMKLVRGQTLRALLQERSDPSQQRGRFLAIFEQICQALGYAHAHRVIHRDLKPANVMVGTHGEVQVMDWGLAKVLREQDDKSKVEVDDPWATEAFASVIDTPEAMGSKTQTGLMLGTPAYMPPEQAGGQVRLLDPRSDVFGLGAILCEILTGKPPYRAKTVNDVRLQALRGELADAIARLDCAGAEPELTALCKRCLAFRQDDRPADGGAVAAEVARIRQAAEERARQAERERERALVRALEQRKRRRVVQIAGGVIAAVLLVGLAFSSWQTVVAQRERDDKAKALEAEETAKQNAERRLTQIEKGVELFEGMLSGIDPRAEEKGGEPLYVQLRERAEKAADQLQSEAVGNPLAEARLQTIMGKTLHDLGSYARAVEVLQRARATREQMLEADHPDTLDTLHTLAGAYQAIGRLPEAIALFQRVRDARVKRLGADHLDTLSTLNSLAGADQAVGKLPQAIALYEQVHNALVIKLGADHPHTLTALNNLALAYERAGNLPEAIALFQQVRDAIMKKRGADHPDTLGVLNNLAAAYYAARRLPDAIKLYEQVRHAQVKKLGSEHPNTLTTLNNLALAYQAARRLPDAIGIYQQVRDARMKKLGADHPDTLNTLSNLAIAYQAAGKLPDAIKLFQQVRDARVKKLGADHPDTLISLFNLAWAYQAAGKLPEALPLFEEAAAGVRKRRFLHQHARWIIANTSAAYEAAKMWNKAETWRRIWMAHVKEKAGADSPAYVDELPALGLNLLRQQRWNEAESVLRESLKQQQMHVPDLWTTFNIMSLLGGALAGQKKHAEAEPLLLKGYQGMKARVKSIPPQGKGCLPESAQRLVELYQAMKRDDEVTNWRQILDHLQSDLR